MSRLIILVDLCWSRDKDPRIPLGHASLLAVLRTVPNLSVRSIVIPVNADTSTPQNVAEIILRHAAGVLPEDIDVALGAYVWGEELLLGVLTVLRGRGFAGRIILGGPQVSYCGEGLEHRYPEVDAFIRGYGEIPLRVLASSPKLRNITGVHWAGTQDRRTLAQADFETLPSPLLTGVVPVEAHGFIRLETQRGCPFQCAYCQHREPGARLARRTFAMSRIEAEIDLLCKANVEDIAVLDPVFNMAPHAKTLLELFAQRNYQGRLSLQCRAEAVDEVFLDAVAPLDVRLELGLQTIHPNEATAVHRRNNIAKVDRVLADVRRRGIDHEVSLIFGLPRQTLASFEHTVRWCLERRIPVIKAFPLLLLRGTALERDRERWQFVDGGGALPMVVQSNSYNRDEWLAMARLSEALHLTEGCHPVRFDELRRLADEIDPRSLCWQVARRKAA